MPLKHFLDGRGTKSGRRRSRLTVESLEQRVPLAADVASAIAPISISFEPAPGVRDGMVAKPMPVVIVGDGGASSPGFSGDRTGSDGAGSEPVGTICVMPEPGVVTSIDKPAVTGGPEGGAENVVYMTTAVQRTNTSGARPAMLVSQRLGGQPRIAPVVQQAARPRQTNEIQATSLPVARQPQQTGSFSRQIAARFGRLSAATR